MITIKELLRVIQKLLVPGFETNTNNRRPRFGGLAEIKPLRFVPERSISASRTRAASC
jgi:hypothetical protein